MSIACLARLSTVAAILLAANTGTTHAQTQRFPHDRHDGLFPLCISCHEMEAARAVQYPEAGQCARCHDGVREQRVVWNPPPPRPTLLTYDHAVHARAAQADALVCESCHAPGPERMEVVRAEAGQCLSCHAHEAATHLADARCETCHQPLAGSALPVNRILALPLPPDHESSRFSIEHGAAIATAKCQVCHTRERCTSCHVNAAATPAILAMAEAPASLEVPRWTAHYPLPGSHTDPGWLEVHRQSAEPAECATCHTRDDCTSCHVETPPRVVSAFPAAADVEAPGAGLQRMRPATHSTPSFPTSHAALAAVVPSSCIACHGRTDCTACHDVSARADFHPVDFAERHATAAWARRLECANCHETERFCGECHRTTAVGMLSRRGAFFHDAEPVWLLRHGQAARQAMESCASCHRQPDCLRCHSQLGAFRANPHGPGFDARRASERNAIVCRICHLRDPLGGG